MTTRENIALFDRFIRGEMDETETEAFEERLNHSESFKKAFESYTAFAKEIKEGSEYLAIQNELATIHADLYKKKKRKSINLLRPKFLVPIGIAASITLLLFFNPFWNGISDQKSTVAYEPLANHSDDYPTEEVGEMEMDLNLELVENVGDSDSVYHLDSLVVLNDSLEITAALPNGTAFLISEDGFFLTSKHLVEGYDIIHLQHKEINSSFEAQVIYTDSLLDFAILQSSIHSALDFKAIPYELVKTSPELGDEVFTLGYSKREIVYTEGVVSSETGFESDSVYFEISLPSNAGHSGAPLFNKNGELIGIVTAQNSQKQAVTYVLKHSYIENRLQDQMDAHAIDMSTNYSKKRLNKTRRIKLYRPFIFEIHTESIK